MTDGIAPDGRRLTAIESVSGYTSTVSFNRANDTATYTANDAIGGSTTAGDAVLEFTDIGPEGGGDVLFTSSTLMIALSAVPSGMTSFTLHLYSATPPSAYADNAAWDLPSGDRSVYLGAIELGTPVDLGSTLFIGRDIINKQRRLTSSSVFGYLVTAGGYTPAAQTVYTVGLHALRV